MHACADTRSAAPRRQSGAAFIKWAQWAATRGDLFPQDFCDTMSSLHEGAPVHSYAHTRRAVESAFGLRLDQLFITFDPRPLASGSVAQVCGCAGCWVH